MSELAAWQSSQRAIPGPGWNSEKRPRTPYIVAPANSHHLLKDRTCPIALYTNTYPVDQYDRAVNRSQIFAHRGLWKESSFAPNSIASFESSFDRGFAVETDVRDHLKEIVISHDPCGPSTYHPFNKDILALGRVAINIKADGLVPLLCNFREQLHESKSFVFDCSFPQILQYKKASIPHALRISEFEKELPWNPDYIWLDSFTSDWWLKDFEVRKMMEKFPTIIVSPELHERDHTRVWEVFFNLTEEVEHIGICTDFPLKLVASQNSND